MRLPTLLIIFLGISGFANFAQSSIIPDDHCVIVMASAGSAQGILAKSEIIERVGPFWLVEARNGAVAAITGSIKNEDSAAFISAAQDEGLLPNDSFCMGGDKIRDFMPGSPFANQPLTVLASPSDMREYEGGTERLSDGGSTSALNPDSDVVIGGISWNMAPDDMAEKLQSEGLTCTNGDLGSGKIGYDCSGLRGQVQIAINNPVIVFDCKFTNTCGLMPDVVIERLSDSFPVIDYYEDVPLSDMSGTHYCVVTASQNEVCTMWSIFLQSYIALRPHSPRYSVNFQ